ncbi:MAG: radical SAM protein [Candidatus Gastranaerophilales bacterium]|nr:radical SAM protein [Candidatus Gastranaerophilales bacterium]
MKYTSCIHLEHGITFFSTSVQICCISSHPGGGGITEIENYKGELINWEEFFSKRNKLREGTKNGVIPEKCAGCYYLKEQEWNNNNYIDEVLIGHFTNCNCNCIYCYTDKDKDFFNANKTYNIYPVIKDMIEKGVLSKNATITFGGGEPTILKEFEELIYLLLDYDVHNIRIHSDGIKYSPAIEKGLKLGKIALITSVDASSKAVYEKIKRVPCFDKVWKNLDKYAKTKNGLIRTKYVLIPGINDNLSEVKNWLQKTYEAGIKNIAFDIEDNWFKAHKDNIPKYIYIIFDFVSECYKQYNIESCELYERAYNLKVDRENKCKASIDN